MRTTVAFAFELKPATFLQRPTAALITYYLSRRLRLRRSSFRLAACLPLAFRLLTFRGRLLDCDFLAGVVVADFVSGPTGDFRTAVAVSPEAMIASQRTPPVRLSLHGVQGVGAGVLHIELHPGMLVEEVKRPLRRRIPVAIDRAGVAADPAQFGLQGTWKIDRCWLVRFISRWRQRSDLLFLGLLIRCQPS